jgi:SAM-dependent methyltransferase
MSASFKRRTLFPLWPEAPLPEGVSEATLMDFLESVRIVDAPEEELRTYCREDFWRFVRTYNLVRELDGKCLELGANPYFITMLLREFTNLDLTLANYFDSARPRRHFFRPFGNPRAMRQAISFRDRQSDEESEITLVSSLFDIESERFPFANEEFDVVLCCEIIEHLTSDPLAALREIKRVLRTGGVFVLTTPNVNRLENVVKMITGVNIYDPYSGYGPLGRHNREYNKHELYVLLTYLGFELDCLESADVHENPSLETIDWNELTPLVKDREHDLGQYLFVRAYNTHPAGTKRPDFLFRSYPDGEVEPVPAFGAGNGG